jgi:hypothetical protein
MKDTPECIKFTCGAREGLGSCRLVTLVLYQRNTVHAMVPSVSLSLSSSSLSLAVCETSTSWLGTYRGVILGHSPWGSNPWPAWQPANGITREQEPLFPLLARRELAGQDMHRGGKQSDSPWTHVTGLPSLSSRRIIARNKKGSSRHDSELVL